MTKEELFDKNIKLAYKITNEYRINYSSEIDDIKQLALLGLWKSVLTYNGKYTFSTYAYRVIHNEINMALRKIRKNSHMSLEEEIGENITLQDIIKDPVNCIEDFEDETELKEIARIKGDVLSKLKPKYRQVYRYLEEGKKQTEVSLLVGYTQTYVSRIKKKIDKEIAKEFWKENR